MPLAAQLVPTSRTRTFTRSAGPADAPLVVLVHGNVSSGAFFEPLAERLAERHRVLVPDLRGYGESDPAPVDATRGLRDFSDDLRAWLSALGLAARPAVLLGWSVGAGVVMQYAIDNPGVVAGLVLEAPMSPYGFGATRDLRGTPAPDFAGSGGGAANPEFVRLLAAGERGGEGPFHARSVMNAFYFKPPFRAAPELEEAFVSSMLRTRTGEDHYPGDLVASPHWPGVGPGSRGVLNALSPKHCDLSGFSSIDPRPPVLWIRGADDPIVSDASLFDLANLGKLGAVPGWPGDAVAPPQPMVGQMRHVLDAYAAAGGRYREEVFEACGHAPHIEHPDRFLALLADVVASLAR